MSVPGTAPVLRLAFDSSDSRLTSFVVDCPRVPCHGTSDFSGPDGETLTLRADILSLVKEDGKTQAKARLTMIHTAGPTEKPLVDAEIKEADVALVDGQVSAFQSWVGQVFVVVDGQQIVGDDHP